MHPADRHLLGKKWRDNICIHQSLHPLSLRSVTNLFNIIADILAWIMKNVAASYLIHYLDDYLTMGPPQSIVCQQNLDIFIPLYAELGIPLAAKKLDGISASYFLGIILYAEHLEIRLPADKLTTTLDDIYKCPRKSYKEAAYITLHHSTKVVQLGRAFIA